MVIHHDIKQQKSPFKQIQVRTTWFNLIGFRQKKNSPKKILPSTPPKAVASAEPPTSWEFVCHWKGNPLKISGWKLKITPFAKEHHLEPNLHNCVPKCSKCIQIVNFPGSVWPNNDITVAHVSHEKKTPLTFYIYIYIYLGGIIPNTKNVTIL